MLYSRNLGQFGLLIAFELRELILELGNPNNLHRLQYFLM